MNGGKMRNLEGIKRVGGWKKKFSDNMSFVGFKLSIIASGFLSTPLSNSVLINNGDV